MLTGPAAAQQSATISDVLVDEGERPIGGAGFEVIDVMSDACPESAPFPKVNDGTFRVDLPPSVYAVTAVPRRPGLNLARSLVDTRNGPVQLTLQAKGGRWSFGAEQPPIASRITISEPNADGVVRIKGAAGSIPASNFAIAEEAQTSSLTYKYDGTSLRQAFPNLDLGDQNGYQGSDVITMSFFVSGTDTNGKRHHFARQVVLQGEQLHMSQSSRSKRRVALPR